MTDFFIAHKSIIIVLHAISAAVGLGAVVVTDVLFFEFLKDFKISLKESKTLDTLSRIIWVVIVLLFITGLALYLSAPMDYLAKSKFVTKLIVFGVIVANGVFLNLWISPHLRKISFGMTITQPSLKLRLLRRIAFASGAISGISWFAVFILGSIRSIPITTPEAILVYLGIITVGVIGSQGYATYLKYWAR